MLKTPTVAASAFVAPNVTLWGDITIEDDVVLLPGVVMRAEVSSIRVGAGSNVQDNAVFHVDEGTPLDVGKRVTIGHAAVLHGCTVGHDSLIGIGAIVLNRAVIGEHSLVAAGALVPEGKVFPPRSLVVGSPARVLRQVSDEEVDRMAKGIGFYQSFAAMYRAAGLGDAST
jgi:carbonic anhydrase/acetyltransferase-like protein (isoleucine patch superfamily)